MSICSRALPSLAHVASPATPRSRAATGLTRDSISPLRSRRSRNWLQLDAEEEVGQSVGGPYQNGGMPGPTLFVFVDESGNFDFSAKGTDYFVLGAFATTDPIGSAACLQALKYRLMEERVDVASFHAAEDRQVVRNAVFEALGQLSGVHMHAIYGDKHLAAPSKQSAEALYILFGRALIRYILRYCEKSDIRATVVIFDRALTAKQRGAFEQAIKPELKASGRPFRVYFQQMSTDLNGQIADDVSWARYVGVSRSEYRPWKALLRVGASDFNIFRTGHTRYY